MIKKRRGRLKFLMIWPSRIYMVKIWLLDWMEEKKEEC